MAADSSPRSHPPSQGTQTPDRADSDDNVDTHTRLTLKNRTQQPSPENDNDPKPPTEAAAAALVPLPPLANAVSDRFIPEFPAEILVLPPRIGRLTDAFFRDELPFTNGAIKHGELSVERFAEAIRGRLSKADLDGLARLAPRMPAANAVYTLGALGMIAACLVYHHRNATGDRQSSDGLALLPGLEEALIAYGRATGVPPCANAYNVWVINAPWSFTGTEGERRFRRAVRKAELWLGEAVGLIDDVRTSKVPLADATGRLERAAGLVAKYVAVQADLAKRPFGPDFIRMRDFLAPFEVDGLWLEGPNATYTAAWTDLDLSVGLLGNDFHEVARGRTPYMPPDYRLQIDRSIDLPSLCDVVADSLGVDRASLKTWEEESLRRLVLATPIRLRRGIFAAADLAHQVARLSAVHLAAIRRNLLDAVEQMSAEDKARLAVSPAGGVGGRALDHTIGMKERRMQHPLVLIHRPGKDK